MPEKPPDEIAMELLNSGFTKPVVIDALVAEGVERATAREIVTALQKARYRQIELDRQAARRYQARACMLGGAALFFFSCFWIYYSATHMKKVAMVQWIMLTGGFFLFLYGFSQRKGF